MKPLSNLHTHTIFSDGRNTAEEMVRAAIDLGFFSLGFSDHGVDPHGDAAMTPEAEQAYIAEIRRLQPLYADRIEIVLGCEHDPDQPDYDFSPYAYIIQSIHWLHNNGEGAPIDMNRETLQRAIDRMYGGDPYAMTASYCRALCQSLEQFPCDIVGHIGLQGKFNDKGDMFDPTDRRYVEPTLEVFRLAAEKDRIVEINTGAIARGYRTSPYPERNMLRYLKDVGGRITFGSDCHNAAYLDCAFDQAAEFAREAGFTEFWVWKNGGFVPQQL